MEMGWGGRNFSKKVCERFGLSLGDLGEGLWKQSFLLDFLLLERGKFCEADREGAPLSQ